MQTGLRKEFCDCCMQAKFPVFASLPHQHMSEAHCSKEQQVRDENPVLLGNGKHGKFGHEKGACEKPSL